MDFFGVQSVDTIGKCTTSYLLARPVCCNALLALPTEAKIFCFKFIIKYNSLKDFGPHVIIGLFLYEDF